VSPAELEFNNIDRIEVLKGPQGTLFGRNSTGGLINIITADPSQTPTLSAEAGFANYNTSTGSVYASAPVNDAIAAACRWYIATKAKVGTGSRDRWSDVVRQVCWSAHQMGGNAERQHENHRFGRLHARSSGSVAVPVGLSRNYFR